MDLITALLSYGILCLFICLTYTFKPTRCVHFLLLPVLFIARGLNRLLPRTFRVFIRRLVTWFLFQNHCLYQIFYVLLLLGGHCLLISRVITVLYQYLEWENHLFVTLACLLFNCLTYTAVCLTDPGIITPQNLPVFSKAYHYDNVLYSPVECSSCSHLIPARARHCARCDHCVYRFEHHCVWTNCCIGGLNYGYFLLFLLSTLAMTANATWLTLRMLHQYVEHEKLWNGHFMDRDGSLKPVNWMVLIQYVFMNLPSVVTMGLVLGMVSLFLTIYVMFHCWLVLTNKTVYEYTFTHRTSRPRRVSAPLAPHTLHEQPRQVWSSNIPTIWQPGTYDRGLLANVSDAFGYRITTSLRELRRRLPPQLEFNTC